jgi:hypothetical protein
VEGRADRARSGVATRPVGLSGHRVSGRIPSRAAHRIYASTACREGVSTRLPGKVGHRGRIGRRVRDQAKELARREEAAVRFAEKALRDQARNRERDGRSRHSGRSPASGRGQEDLRNPIDPADLSGRANRAAAQEEAVRGLAARSPAGANQCVQSSSVLWAALWRGALRL